MVAELQSNLRVCNASTAAQIPEIWNTIVQLKKDQTRDAMEAVCRRTEDGLRFRPPHIPHTATVMVTALNFHTKYPDRVEDTLNIFLFPDLSPLAG